MKMTLSNGTVLDNLTLNGTNYISQTELTEDMFTDGLDTITVEDEKNTYTLANCVLEYVRQYGNEWWFVLRELTDKEVKDRATDAQVTYTALMTDTLMEE